MTLLIKKFIKDYENIKSPHVRASYGKLSSIYGIFWNVLLFVSKLVVGFVFHSVAITADAFNNLSDAGTSIISLISFFFSSKPADEDHPFGHERLEYIASLIVAFMIIFFGLQLIGTSFDQILNPTDVDFSVIMVVTLIVSIAVKFYMYLYNTKYSKLLDSSVMRSTALDSISDVMSTSAVLIGLLISMVTSLQLDGYLGIIVAFMIIKGGYEIISETFNKLIGEAPSQDLIKHIVDKILSYEGIHGVHDLVIHNYGPSKVFVTIHAEVSSDEDILKSHDIIDNIEKDFAKEDQINLVIHMDPIVLNDEFTNHMREKIVAIVKAIDSGLSIHDFRVVKGETHHNVIFDVDVPIEFAMSDSELLKLIEESLPQEEIPIYGVITIDRAYISTTKKADE